MATSGSFSGTLSGRYSGHYNVRIDWSVIQNTANNQSTITCAMYFEHDWAIGIGTRTHSITIAGTSYSLSSGNINANSGSHYIGSCSHTITHNSDGTLSDVSISGTFSFNASLNETDYFTSINASNSIAIDAIPRKSKPTLSVSSGYIGNSITIYTNPKSPTFLHNVYYDAGDGWVGIGYNVSQKCHWDVPMSLANKVTIGRTLAVAIYVETYNEGKYIDYDSTIFTAYVPETTETKPTLVITSIDSDGALDTSWVQTHFVQNKTKVVATVTGSAKLGADISSYEMSVEGGGTTTSTSNVLTSDTLTKSGIIEIKCKAKDSREIYSDEVYFYTTVIPYSKPTLIPYGTNSAIICARCDSSGALNNTGTSLKVSVRVKVFSLQYKENTAALQIRCYSTTTDSGWFYLMPTISGGGVENNYISYYDFNGVVEEITLDADKEYYVEICGWDRLGEAEYATYQIPSQDVCFHLRDGGKGAAFGEYAEEENVLSINKKWTMKVKGTLAVIGDNGIAIPTIVDNGESGIWTYRKWSDGTAECWGTYECTDLLCSYTWGSMYESGAYGGILYPFKFTERPLQYLSISKTTDMGLLLEYPQKEDFSVNENNTGYWWFVRPAAQITAGAAYVDIYVRGKWK